MGNKLQPIDRVIKAVRSERILRCLVCGRPLDEKERKAMVHITCKPTR